MLYVVEIFKSRQGEGRYIGREAVFVRFAGCNLYCLWCDTKYTWKRKGNRVQEWLSQDLLQKIIDMSNDIDYVVLTGGEPLIQKQDELWWLVDQLAGMGYDVEILTNGTIFPLIPEDIWFDEDGYGEVLVTISPKLDVTNYYPYWIDIFSWYAGDSGFDLCINYVFDCKRKSIEMNRIMMFLEHSSGVSDIYLMPLGVKREEIEEGRKCIDEVIENFKKLGIKNAWKLKLGDRLHIREGFK